MSLKWHLNESQKRTKRGSWSKKKILLVSFAESRKNSKPGCSRNILRRLQESPPCLALLLIRRREDQRAMAMAVSEEDNGKAPVIGHCTLGAVLPCNGGLAGTKLGCGQYLSKTQQHGPRRFTAFHRNTSKKNYRSPHKRWPPYCKLTRHYCQLMNDGWKHTR